MSNFNKLRLLLGCKSGRKGRRTPPSDKSVKTNKDTGTERQFTYSTGKKGRKLDDMPPKQTGTKSRKRKPRSAKWLSLLGTSLYYIIPVLLSVCVSLSMSVIIIFMSHVWICLGVNPESIAVCDYLAPYIGLITGGIALSLITENISSINQPLRVSLFCSFLMSVVLSCFWLLLYVGQLENITLNTIHWFFSSECQKEAVIYWVAAVFAGCSGCFAGVFFKTYGLRYLGWFVAAVFFVIPISMMRYTALSQLRPGTTVTLSPGISAHTDKPSADGTIVRLITCDFVPQNNLHFGLFDNDFHDDVVNDNKNLTYRVTPANIAFDKALSTNRNIRVFFSGSFFGIDSHGYAQHIAPFFINNHIYYNNHVLSSKWPDQTASFGVKYVDNKPEFHLIPNDSSLRLADMDYAIGGLRLLRRDGFSEPLTRGIGETSLRCSRTSIGWDYASQKFYILMVRSVNNEDSNRKRLVQYGGWDIGQVQKYWETMGVPNALLCNSGDASQLVTMDKRGRRSFISSNHIGSVTLGYWHQRPLRIYIPMLPVYARIDGGLNYIYVRD